MNTNFSRRTVLAAGLAALSPLAHAQSAQNAQLIKLVVPFSSGGVTDLAARLLAEQMAQRLGQTVIIENRPGAGSRLGIDAVAKSPRNASTLLFTNTSYSILPVVEPRIAFDPTKDLAAVAMTAVYGLGMVVGNNIPAHTLPEFIAYAKKNPGKLSYGSAGPGSGAHFAGEYFKALTGTSLIHVPYRSTSAAVADVAGGVLDLAFDASAKAYIDSGKVRLLAVTDARRDPRFPEVPTAAESGLPDFVMSSWLGLFAPAGTPAAAVERLNKAANEASADQGLRKRMQDLGLVPQSDTPERFAQQVREDLVFYRRIAAGANLKFE